MELEPHPLVVGLALRLGSQNVQDAISQATTAAEEAGAPPPFLGPDELGDFGVAPESASRFRSFAGYLGGSVPDPVRREAAPPGAAPEEWQWQVLFLDANLHHWLIVLSEDIQYFDRVKDDTAAGGQRDYVWVLEDALIGRGDPATSAAGVVRSGTFSRAADLATSLRGDTNARRSGLMVEAVTPLCGCGRYSQ